MNDMILLKQGEMVLKGLNRRSFETRLIANVKRRLAPFGDFRVYAAQSAIYAEPRGDCDMDGAYAAAKTVFGVAALSRAAVCAKNPDAIFDTARRYLGGALTRAKSFKVESKRADKSFPMTSIALSQHIGGLLSDAYPHVAVDVRAPEFTVQLEVRDYAAYVHGLSEDGAGGMPVGTNGRAVSLLSGGIDSPVSTYLAAKRGLSVIPIHFCSPPYTSELAKKKVVDLAKSLTKYCGRLTLEVVPFTHIQEEIGKSCPEELYTVIMRRFMMRIADKIAENNAAAALFTGENLGQVASQTLEAMAVTEACATRPVLRPLICFDKREIVALAAAVGTFGTSILPYEDCCTVFTPRRPATKPKLEKVEAAEAALDIAGLTAEAIAGIERIRLDI
ncbi:MAG: tRNA 4-thiouridine(8) synthase ThiI [Oscillospiraceae bacterium]|jgi:thiamine biosynthesis protein ThiI|nr:tRNA 4-thiouridine(8) synthase ThiI [Oscillospiraceae bacterium]